jgi:tRNA nucleotidyltransferase (CCA-adding enzyme)
VVIDHQPIEITTYRVEGGYSDNRRPDTVSFVGSLRDDLSRRDFTVNAMAYHPRGGLVDLFGGQADLAAKIIRCVGDANERFQEDALRIMRALRFSSVLGFSIEPGTAEAIHRCRDLLKNIAPERVAAELSRLVIGDGVESVLLGYAPALGVVIPEITASVGFQQNSEYHHLNVWQHTAAAVAAAAHGPDDAILRLAVLLHDIGKPQCYTETGGTGHFYGHPKVGEEMANTVLHRLKYDNRTIRAVTRLVRFHDTQIVAGGKAVKRWLNRFGEETFRLLLEVKRADILAHAPWCRAENLEHLERVQNLLENIIAERQCFQLKDLAVNGRDLIALGVPEGAMIGTVLKRLMDRVLNETLDNEREALLDAARGIAGSPQTM